MSDMELVWCAEHYIYRFQMPVVEELQTLGCKLHLGQLVAWSCTHGVKTKISKLKLQQGHSNCERFTVFCMTSYFYVKKKSCTLYEEPSFCGSQNNVPKKFQLFVI